MDKLLKLGIFLLLIGLLQVVFYQEPLPEQFVDTEFGRIAYNSYGEGDKILIGIHGSPGSKDDYDNLGPLLNEYTFYAPDMPGFGESTMRANNYGFSQSSNVLMAFMDELEIEKAEIIGYSWGGGVASTFAHDYPERTEHIYLLAGVGVPKSAHTQNHYTETFRYIISFVPTVIYPGAFAPKQLDIYHRHGMIRSFLDADQRKQYDIMSNIQVPTTIIHGDKDTVVLLSGAKIHNELIPNSTLYIYEGGHGEIFGESSKLATGVRYRE